MEDRFRAYSIVLVQFLLDGKVVGSIILLSLGLTAEKDWFAIARLWFSLSSASFLATFPRTEGVFDDPPRDAGSLKIPEPK
jgi:hypothetical protein